MRRAQDRARSARSRKNGARSATIKLRAPGALKLASDENVPAKRADVFKSKDVMYRSTVLKVYEQLDFYDKGGVFPNALIYRAINHELQCGIWKMDGF